MATISDKRFGVTTDSVVQYYLPDVVSANDYYPFGMLQPGRSYAQSGTGYRYGFNGKEKDDEVKGVGDQIDYGDRIYNPRIGRWLSVEPLQSKFSDVSPYVFSSNNPIANIDVNGEYALFIHYMLTKYLLMQAGVSEVQAKLIAHYASTFSDNPAAIANFNQLKDLSVGTGIIGENMQQSQKDNPIFERIGGKLSEEESWEIDYDIRIDYSRTVNSQSENADAQLSHATRTSAEKNQVSSADAMQRSLENAWTLLFKSASEGSIDKMEINSEAIQDLGQALHSFQDIQAHQGAVFKSRWYNLWGFFSRFGNEHDLNKDSHPEPTHFTQAMISTGNAILVHQIMSGNFKRLQSGQHINTKGMTTDQIDKLKDKLKTGGFTMGADGEGSYMYTVSKEKH